MLLAIFVPFCIEPEKKRKEFPFVTKRRAYYIQNLINFFLRFWISVYEFSEQV